jgi:hypothetical protein
MAVVAQSGGRSRGARGGQVFGFGRIRGLGDYVSDAYLATPTGQQRLANAQAAAAKLPAGYTMGDPTSSLWGAAYYNGVKLMSSPDDPAVMALIQAAADAAYQVFNPIDAIRTSTNPDMQAVLLDPEWIALEGSGPIDWNTLSPTLQAKIKKVPNLYNSLIGNLSALTPPLITSGPTVAPTGPARYLQGGIEFLDNGTVLSVNGQAVSGITLTPDEVHSLMTTGSLPPGDTTFAPPAPPPPPPLPPPSTSTTSTPTTPGPAILPPLPPTSGNGSYDSANPGSSGSSFSSGASPFDMSSAPAPAAVVPVASSSSSTKWLLIAGAGIAALAFLHPHTRPSRRRRRR